MSTPEPLAEALAPTAADRGMADECAKLAREFPGWDVTWTSRHGFRARKGEDEIGPSTSWSAVRCLLAKAEHRGMAR